MGDIEPLGRAFHHDHIRPRAREKERRASYLSGIGEVRKELEQSLILSAAGFYILFTLIFNDVECRVEG